MERAELKMRIREYLHDPEGKIWGDPELEEMLEAAARSYCLDTEIFRGVFNLDVNAEGVCKVPKDYLGFLAGWNEKGYRIERAGAEEVKRYYPDYTKVSGAAEFAYEGLNDIGYIRLCPNPYKGAESEVEYYPVFSYGIPQLSGGGEGKRRALYLRVVPSMGQLIQIGMLLTQITADGYTRIEEYVKDMTSGKTEEAEERKEGMTATEQSLVDIVLDLLPDGEFVFREEGSENGILYEGGKLFVELSDNVRVWYPDESGGPYGLSLYGAYGVPTRVRKFIKTGDIVYIRQEKAEKIEDHMSLIYHVLYQAYNADSDFSNGEKAELYRVQYRNRIARFGQMRPSNRSIGKRLKFY